MRVSFDVHASRSTDTRTSVSVAWACGCKHDNLKGGKEEMGGKDGKIENERGGRERR